MRVLHIVPSLAARDGGPSEVALHLSEALTRRGLTVDLAFTAGETDGEEYGASAARLRSDRFHAHAFPRLMNGSFKYSPSLGRWMRGACDGFDLVHIHAVFSYPSVAAARAARDARVPYVWRPAGSLTRWSLDQSALRKRIALKAGVERLIREAAVVHCTSAAEALEIDDRFPAVPTAVIPNGVDERLFALARYESKTVLYMGRLHPKKRPDLVIRGFAASKASEDGWSLVIAGSGDKAYVRTLHELASSLNGATTFAGWVDGSRKVELLQNSALFVLPSRDENFGIAAAEAMAAGVPVLLTKNVGIASEVEEQEAGWTIDAEVESIASAIDAAASDPERRRLRSAAARRLADERFRWERVSESMQDLYERICEDRR